MVRNIRLSCMIMWPLHTKILVCAIGCFMLMSLAGWLLTQSAMSEYRQLQESALVLRQAFEVKAQQAASLNSLRSHVSALQSQAKHRLNQLTDVEQTPNILEHLSKIGLQNGLYFESFNPLPEKKAGILTILPVNMVILGNYHQLIRYLTQTSQLTELISWHDLNITQIPSKTKKYIERLNIEITANIYLVHQDLDATYSALTSDRGVYK